MKCVYVNWLIRVDRFYVMLQFSLKAHGNDFSQQVTTNAFSTIGDTIKIHVN